MQVGLYEFVKFHGDRLLARYANPLQVYYFANIAEADGEGQRASNIFGGMDINVLLPDSRLYFDILNDDITVFDDNGSPNKFGIQVGAVYYPDGIVEEVGFEYTHVSWGTYTHHYPGRGNDQDLWHARARFSLPYQTALETELNWQIKGDGRLDEYHWDWPQTKIDSLDLDNIGDFNDYGEDAHLVAHSVTATNSWLPWAHGYLRYTTVFTRDGVSPQIAAGLRLTAPPLFSREELQ